MYALDVYKGLWEWQSKNVNGGAVINYAVHEQYAHYGPNLYDYEAYSVSHYIGSENSNE